MKGTVVVFARAPRLGAVKTRLARDIGALEALRAYRVLLARTLDVAADPRWRTRVALTPDAAVKTRSPRVAPQGRGDLGRRMERAFRSRIPGPVVVIGTDCPAMTRGDLAVALAALGSADAVFGPAEDGGYWLIGLKRLRATPRLFAGVRWSSVHALADTLASLPRSWRVARLRALADVDDGEGWRRAKAEGLRRVRP